MTTLPSAAAAENVTVTGLARRSHEIIAGFQHSSGAYPASPTFQAYQGYAWYRDGSFTAEGVSRYGDVTSASRFHDWAASVLEVRRDQIDELVASSDEIGLVPVERMLPTRFTLDGREGTDEWWDFQLDGYGTWLWAAINHARRHELDLGRWQAGLALCADYVTAFWDRPCYDWWEEHVEQRHVSTLAALYGGLTAAVSAGVLDRVRTDQAEEAAGRIREMVATEGVHGGHLAKWLGSAEVDASLAAAIVPFGLVEPGSAVAQGTLDAISQQLAVDGGVHRFRADVFYGGGQWPLLSAFLGWNRAAHGDQESALISLHWIAEQATASGELPEQVSHHLLAPDQRQRWIDRWGPVATPLLWSHGMYLILADELGVAR